MSIRVLLRSLIAVAVLGATVVATSPVLADSPDPGVVRVDGGWLRGGIGDDHVTYSAIPYAAPPVGERRWQPPGRPRSWPGIRDATTPSPPCPQQGRAGVEDCLYLDVTASRHTRGRLPVLVWLHGGGLSSGGAQQQDGVDLAVHGDLVVVTLDYRSGALGFLSVPHLDGDGDGNYGLMDQAAALRWVRGNVARFGGDPRNVTLAGQSGGARSVCAHLAAPMSGGLFHRAIIQSGACDNPVPTLSEAREFGACASTPRPGCSRRSRLSARRSTAG